MILADLGGGNAELKGNCARGRMSPEMFCGVRKVDYNPISGGVAERLNASAL